MNRLVDAIEEALTAYHNGEVKIRQHIQNADVVHVDKTGLRRDGDQAMLWTFTKAEHTLYAVRGTRGTAVPEEVLGEDFSGTIVCDGWKA